MPRLQALYQYACQHLVLGDLMLLVVIPLTILLLWVVLFAWRQDQ